MSPPPLSGRRLRRPPLPFAGTLRGAWLAAAALLSAATLPVACGESRDRARLAALEAGIASAQASLAAMSAAEHRPAAAAAAATPTFPPSAPLGAPAPVRPAPADVAARVPAGARPLAAAELLGTGPDALRRWFGEPDLRRAEGDAEVVLFLGPGCALDVVLYADAAAGGAKRVAHAAARADGPAAVTEADCLRGIGAGRGGVGGALAAGHTPRR